MQPSSLEGRHALEVCPVLQVVKVASAQELRSADIGKERAVPGLTDESRRLQPHQGLRVPAGVTGSPDKDYMEDLDMSAPASQLFGKVECMKRYIRIMRVAFIASLWWAPHGTL